MGTQKKSLEEKHWKLKEAWPKEFIYFFDPFYEPH